MSELGEIFAEMKVESRQRKDCNRIGSEDITKVTCLKCKELNEQI